MMNLHSTIFILKLTAMNEIETGIITFTFYYIYIKTSYFPKLIEFIFFIYILLYLY